MKTAKNNIKKLRIQHGMTQEELARTFGVTRSAVAQWEQGQLGPGLNRLMELADYFHVTTDYVLGRSEFSSNDPDPEYTARALADAGFVVSVETSCGNWRGEWFATAEQARSFVSEHAGQFPNVYVRRLAVVDSEAFMDGDDWALAETAGADGPSQEALPEIGAADAHAMRDALVESIAERRALKERCVEEAIDCIGADDIEGCKAALELASGHGEERRRFEHALEALDLYRDVAGIVPWD